jgi:hypothetical protein
VKVPAEANRRQEQPAMKYLIMMTQSPDDPVQEWTPDDVKASWAHMQQIHQEMTEAGELIAAEKLAGPKATKIVASDGVSAPVITDGVYPEAKELLAGFWMVDVDSEQRAIEIAAIVVRPIMDAPPPEW